MKSRMQNFTTRRGFLQKFLYVSGACCYWLAAVVLFTERGKDSTLPSNTRTQCFLTDHNVLTDAYGDLPLELADLDGPHDLAG